MAEVSPSTAAISIHPSLYSLLTHPYFITQVIITSLLLSLPPPSFLSTLSLLSPSRSLESGDMSTPVSYPAPPPAGYPREPQYVAPPPAFYNDPMMKDGQYQPPQPPPVETRSRGDGFCKGCCAALCCCCLLDACF